MSESASGEASSSTDADGKDFSCPTCGKAFDNQTSMKIHHNHAHGESIAGREVECAYCGVTFRKDAYEAEQYEEHYCGDECQNQRYSERYTGENNPFWSGGMVSVECAWCGSDLERIPAETAPGKSHFCNLHECKAKYQSQPYSGEGNPNYKGGEVSCTWCGNDLERDMNQIERSEHFFCGDTDCKAKWQSEHVRGENHPRWLGGYDGYYGPNWEEERLAPIIRDQARCQTCGATPMSCIDTLLVHHVIPMRVFKAEYEGREVFDRANRVDNLVVLCKVCHMTWEGIPLRPQ